MPVSWQQEEDRGGDLDRELLRAVAEMPCKGCEEEVDDVEEDVGGLSEEDGELSDEESEEEDELSKTNRVTVRLWQIEECDEGSGDDGKNQGDAGAGDEEGNEYIEMMASVRIYDDPLVSSLCGAHVYDAAESEPPGPEITRPVDNIVLDLAGEPSDSTPIMADDEAKREGGRDIEQQQHLVEMNARHRRWLGLPPDDQSDRRGAGQDEKHLQKGAAGRGKGGGRRGGEAAAATFRPGGWGWGCQTWVPLSVMVAALPACESPTMAGGACGKGKGKDSAKRELMSRRIAECERRASAMSSKGCFVNAIEAVEENIVLRARMGGESGQQLVCMLQSVAYLCNAYAVESISRGDSRQAKELIDKAIGLTRKRLLKKCKVTELVRVGLRAATFNTAAFMHWCLEKGSNGAGNYTCAFRFLQRSLRAVRKHRSGLEVVEAATLTNMAALLIARGSVGDAVTVTSASIDLLKTLCPETQAAWDREFTSPTLGCSGRCARLTAVWGIYAVTELNRGVAHEECGNAQSAEESYREGQHLAEVYLGNGDLHLVSTIERCLSRVEATRERQESSLSSPKQIGYMHWGNPSTELRPKMARAGGRKGGDKSRCKEEDVLVPQLLRFGNEGGVVGGLLVPRTAGADQVEEGGGVKKKIGKGGKMCRDTDRGDGQKGMRAGKVRAASIASQVCQDEGQCNRADGDKDKDNGNGNDNDGGVRGACKDDVISRGGGTSPVDVQPVASSGKVSSASVSDGAFASFLDGKAKAAASPARSSAAPVPAPPAASLSSMRPVPRPLLNIKPQIAPSAPVDTAAPLPPRPLKAGVPKSTYATPGERGGRGVAIPVLSLEAPMPDDPRLCVSSVPGGGGLVTGKVKGGLVSDARVSAGRGAGALRRGLAEEGGGREARRDSLQGEVKGGGVDRGALSRYLELAVHAAKASSHEAMRPQAAALQDAAGSAVSKVVRPSPRNEAQNPGHGLGGGAIKGVGMVGGGKGGERGISLIITPRAGGGALAEKENVGSAGNNNNNNNNNNNKNAAGKMTLDRDTDVVHGSRRASQPTMESVEMTHQPRPPPVSRQAALGRGSSGMVGHQRVGVKGPR